MKRVEPAMDMCVARLILIPVKDPLDSPVRIPPFFKHPDDIFFIQEASFLTYLAIFLTS